MENIYPHFYRGDIVDLIEAPAVENKKVNNIRKTLLSAKPYKLIILRQLDDSLYLVVICKETSGKTQIELETNRDPLYVKVSSFFSIDISSLRLCGDLWFKKNKSQVVEEIYTLHNELVEKRKVEQQEKRRKEREAAQKKNAQKRKERNKQKKLEDQHKGPYEIAVMNNDTKKMKEIEDIVGYAPGRKGPGSGSSKRNGKVLYTHFNPRPCSGGRFSPK